MAIGKLDAYATIQAPNVDFGDIAVNAQKFQADMVEKLAAAKAAKVKEEKPFVFTPQVLKNDSGLNWFNISQREAVSQTTEEYYQLKKDNEAGKLEPKDAAKLQALEQNFQNADEALKSVNPKWADYVKGMKDHSGAFKETEDYLEGFTKDNGKNVIRSNDSNGNPYFQQAETDTKTGAVVMGEDGKPKIRKFIDKDGVERDGWGYSDILSGKSFMPLNAFDDKGFATDVAKLVEPYKTATDNGITKITREKLTPENVNSINTMIQTQVLNNKDHLADVLYKLDPVKYKVPRAEYTDEDKAIAKAGMERSIYGGIGLSNIADKNAPTNININNGPGKPMPTVGTKPLVQTVTHYDEVPGGIKEGEKRKPAYKETMHMLPIQRGQKIDVSGIDANVEGIGKSLTEDGKSVRYFLKYTPIANASTSGEADTPTYKDPAKVSNVTVGGKQKTEPKYLYFDGSAGEFMNVASQLVNPETNKYFNTDEEVRRYVDRKLKGYKPSKQQFNKPNSVKVPGL
jgi:hypothetical protein